MPMPILCGVLAHYTVLPTLGFVISRAMGLSPAFSVGLILLGSCPGGRASSLVTYVANGDVALSVLMSAVSTLAASVMTPLLCSVLAGQLVPVSALGLAKSTVQLVLLPVLFGVFMNSAAPGLVGLVRPLMPALSLVVTLFVCALPVAKVAPILRCDDTLRSGVLVVVMRRSV